MQHHQLAEDIAALAGVQGVALTDTVGVPLASCGVDSTVAEQWGATAFLLWRLAEQCSGIVHAGRAERVVLQVQRASLFIKARNETHLVVLVDDSIPLDDLAERITMIMDVPGAVDDLIPRQQSAGNDQ